jgi:tetratricopeptide (TPR) repeat protein
MLLILALCLLVSACASRVANGPAWPDEGASDESSATELTKAEKASILQPRPPAEYWWNRPKDKLPHLVGGKYLDSRDSLGFSDFRKLGEEDQRDRRRSARKHLEKGLALGANRVALSDYATGVGLCPYYPEIWLHYAEAEIQMGNYHTSRYLLQGVERSLRFVSGGNEQEQVASDFYYLDALASYNLGEKDRALESVENCLALRGGNLDARLLRARCLTDLNRFEEARAELSRFEFGSPHYAQAQAVRGVLEMDAGNLKRAERAFSEAYEYGLRSGILENDRGRLALMQNRLDDAVDHFERAVRLMPELMEARNNLAVALRRAGEDARAEQVLNRAIALNPNYAATHFNLAELLRSRLEDLKGDELRRTGREAREHYDAALALHYRPKVILERRAWIYLRLGDLAAAERDLLKLTGTANPDGRVLYLLAHTKQGQNDLRVAQKLYEMAIQRGYDGADVHSDLGEVLLRREDLERARSELEKAISLDGSLVATRLNLCQTLADLGDREAAEKVLKEAEALAPDDPAVRAQRKALDSR